MEKEGKHRKHHKESGAHKRQKKSNKRKDISSDQNVQAFNSNINPNESKEIYDESYDKSHVFSYDELQYFIETDFHFEAINNVEIAKRTFVESLRTLINGYVNEIEEKKINKNPNVKIPIPNFSFEDQSTAKQNFTDDLSQSTGQDPLAQYFQNKDRVNSSGKVNNLLSDSDSPPINTNTPLSSSIIKPPTDQILNDSLTESGEMPGFNSMVNSPINSPDPSPMSSSHNSPPELPHAAANFIKNPPKVNTQSEVKPIVANNDEIMGQDSSDSWSKNGSVSNASKGQTNNFPKRRIIGMNDFDLENDFVNDMNGIV